MFIKTFLTEYKSVGIIYTHCALKLIHSNFSKKSLPINKMGASVVRLVISPGIVYI